jgi:hypothetical protein
VRAPPEPSLAQQVITSLRCRTLQLPLADKYFKTLCPQRKQTYMSSGGADIGLWA